MLRQGTVSPVHRERERRGDGGGGARDIDKTEKEK